MPSGTMGRWDPFHCHRVLHGRLEAGKPSEDVTCNVTINSWKDVTRNVTIHFVIAFFVLCESILTRARSHASHKNRTIHTKIVLQFVLEREYLPVTSRPVILTWVSFQRVPPKAFRETSKCSVAIKHPSYLISKSNCKIMVCKSRGKS